MFVELINIKGNTWAIPGPVNVGVYVNGIDAVIVDTGNDSSMGRKILRIIEGKGWNIKCIVNTHFHADHIGGNSFIQKRTDCEIAASHREAPFIDFPEMEPQILWSGSAPKSICNKFLQAEPSKVTKLVSPGDEIKDYGLKIIGLPGHAHGQIGIITKDNVFFTADSIIAARILKKYGIPFVADYVNTMSTFDLLEKSAADFFVPSHGDICSDIGDMVNANRNCLLALREEILDICSEPKTRDDILCQMSCSHGINMNITQYILTHSTVAAIVAPLIDSGKLECSFDSGTLTLVRTV